jgi:tRNA (mo5U34)-methyltransferase
VQPPPSRAHHGNIPAVVELLSRAREQTWYHTLELPGGEVTPGIFDLRPYIAGYGIPERLDGMRVLEVGTWDGFWAFELERRGAEVVALDLDDERDLDWPPRRRPTEFPDEPRGKGFALARELLGSAVDRRDLSIYDATPDELGGRFDLVLCGSVLIHLRDQLLALQRMAELTKPGGLLISAEEYDRLASLVPFPVSRYRADRESAVVFWLPGIKTSARMLWTAGYDDVRRHGRFRMRSTEGWSVRHVVHHARKGP